MMRILSKIFFLIFCLTLIVVFWFWSFSQTTLSIPKEKSVILIKPGVTMKLTARQLVADGVLREPWSFYLLSRFLGQASKLKAGNYEIPPSITPQKLIDILTSGESLQAGITFIEGWTFGQIRQELNKNNNLRHVAMGYTDQEILLQIGANESHPEGLFFPDTYYFFSGMSDLDILKRSYLAMQQKLKQAWDNKSSNLPYSSPYEALIMASIIEKESANAKERTIISRVFLNRLRLGMRLQTDPTVIYGLGPHFDGDLTRRDLLNDTPYNTYTRYGLPPTPIACPGQGAIDAALNPESNSFLYFVGKGNGTHYFSKSLAEHNLAVKKYQLGQYE